MTKTITVVPQHTVHDFWITTEPRVQSQCDHIVNNLTAL